MKIIKIGVLPETHKIRRFKCQTCECLFEASSTEYVSSNGKFFCCCPCCGEYAFELEL